MNNTFAVAIDDSTSTHGGSGAAITAASGDNIQLQATDSSSITATAGAVAINGTNGQGGNLGLGVGASISENQLGNTITSTIDNATVAASGVTLTAMSLEQVKSVTLGGSVGVNTGSQNSAAELAGAGAVADNTTTGDMIEASITGGSTVTTSGPVTLDAEDQSSTTADAGGFALSVSQGQQGDTTISFGASVAYNSISGTVNAIVTGSKVSAGGALDLTAKATPTIQTLTLAGSATGASGQNGATGFGGAGTVSYNAIQNNVDAQIGSAGALTQVTTAPGAAVALTATDNSSITANAGGLAVAVATGQGSSKSIAIGAAIAVNNVGNSIGATIDNATVMSGGDIGLTVNGDENTNALAVGIGGAMSHGQQGGVSFAGASSFAINHVNNTFATAIDNSSTPGGSGPAITATNGNLQMQATDKSSITAAAGAVALSSASGQGTDVGLGIGVSVSINQLGNTITSSIDNATVAAGGVTLTATSFEQIKALSVAGSLAVGSSSESSATAFAGAGAVSENSATNGTIEASITSGSTVTSSGGAVTLDAEDQSSITAIAGEAALSDASGSSGSGAAESLGASLAFNSIDGATVESLIDASTVSAESLSLRALGNATIQATTLAADGSVAGGQGGGLAITGAGAGSSNTISGLIAAEITGGSQINCTGSGTALGLSATDTSSIHAIATGVRISSGGQNGSSAGAGAAIASNTIANAVVASIQGSTATVDGGVTLAAESLATIVVFTLGLSGALGGGSSGSYNLTGAGSGSGNQINDTVEASITTGKKGSTTVGSNVRSTRGAVKLTATDNATINSSAGAGTFGTGVGASIAVNSIGDIVSAFTDGSTVISGNGPIVLTATAVQNIQTIAVGAAAASDGSFVGAGSYDSTDANNSIEAYVMGGTLTAQGGVTIAASDASGGNQTTIIPIAGAVGANTGDVAVGAAVADTTLENTLMTFIDGATVTSQTGDVDVTASSDPMLNSAAFAIAGANSFALGGSVILTKDRNVVDSAIDDGAMVTAQGSVLVSATDTPALQIAAGGVSGSESVAAGAAVVINDIGDTVKAHVDGATVTASDGSIQVLATYTADMTHVGAVGGGFGSTAGIAGSVEINDIGNTVQASVTNQANVSTDDSVAVIAQTETDLSPIVGTLAVGSSAGVGGSVLYDNFFDNTQAFISANSVVSGRGHQLMTVPTADGSTDTTSASGVAVIATTNNVLTEVNVNAAGASSAAVAGTVCFDTIGDTTVAYIDNSTVNPSANSANASAVPGQAVLVRAANHTDGDTTAGVGAIAGTAGVGATSDTTLIHNTTHAYIADSATVSALGDVEVTAFTQEAVNAIIISVAGSLGVSVAGQVPVISLKSSTEADIDSSTVDSSGDLKVLANTDDRLGSRKGSGGPGIIAGEVAIGATAGVGGSVIVAIMDPTTTAHVSHAATNAAGTTQVDADSLENEKTYDITAAGGFYVGVAGAIIVTSITPETEAYIDGGSQVNQDPSFANNLQNVTVEATDSTTAVDLAGSAGGGIVGAGASIDVLSVDNATVAYIDVGSTVSAAGDVKVLAVETRNVTSTVLAFSGGLVALQAGISVVNVGSGMSADAQSRAGGTEAAVNTQMQGPAGTKIGNLPDDPDGVGSAAQANANAQTSNMNVDGVFNTAAPAALGTSASIRGAVTAGGSVTVQATDTSQVETTSGSGGGGLVSVGAAVAIANVSPNTEAYITGTVASGGTITVNAVFTLNGPSQPIANAIAGGGGFVAVAGAVIAVTDNSTQSAYVAGNAQITHARAVNIAAQSTQTLLVLTGQVTGGGVAAGAAVAIVNSGGSTEAYVTGAAQIGEAAGQSVGSLSVTSTSGTMVDVNVFAVSVGGVAGAANDAEAKIENQTISAYIAGSAQVQTTGDIDVEAVSTAATDAESDGVTLGAAGSLDVSLTTSTITPTVSAYIGDTAKVRRRRQPDSDVAGKRGRRRHPHRQ